jgi:tryptophanyl-tRNA synthetase
MSKSANNAIYLTDNEDVLKQKVMSMYTDPKHIKIEDPGNVEGNIVFTYLDAFCKDDSFEKYLPEYKNLNELKEHYKNGGLGDMKIKRFLFEVLNDELKPIRERRQKYSENIDEVYKMLYEGSKKAREVAKDTLSRVRKAIGIEYFEGK